MKRLNYALSMLAMLLCTPQLHAAYVAAVDLNPDPGQTLHPNFSFGGDTTSASESIPSYAIGLPAHDSIFGGNGMSFGDTYIMSYAPGADVDNFFPASGSILGSTTGYGTEIASGLAGGTSGYYKVYITGPETVGISSTSNITITGDGAPVQLLGVDMNNGGTGADQDPGPAFVGGANNAWYLLGQVHLTAENTYTMTQVANANTFVSQRLAGVMWERVVPEPTSIALLGIGAVFSFTALSRPHRKG